MCHLGMVQYVLESRFLVFYFIEKQKKSKSSLYCFPSIYCGNRIRGLFTVKIASVVPVLTVFTPSRFTPLLNTILTINGRGIYRALSVVILVLAGPL